MVDRSQYFSRIKKMLGRIETRTRDRIYCQTMRTVSDISRDDRARIATCSLRTPTDRQTDLKENYSIDLASFISQLKAGFVILLHLKHLLLGAYMFQSKLQRIGTQSI